MTGIKEDGAVFETAVRAKLFRHGGSQAVRLPRAFRFEGEEVLVHREGDRVILEPVRRRPPRTPEEIAAFFARIHELSRGEFPERDQPAMQERDFW